jgi:DNA-binding response OmpR family regulator
MTLENKIILLVEDDSLISRMYERGLTKKGARVVTASNGAEGLEKLRTENINLITLDLMMPKMNGHDMLKVVKADTKTKDIPILVLTNLHDKPEEIEKVKQMGIQEYFIKSETSMEKFIERVEHHLN